MQHCQVSNLNVGCYRMLIGENKSNLDYTVIFRQVLLLLINIVQSGNNDLKLIYPKIERVTTSQWVMESFNGGCYIDNVSLRIRLAITCFNRFIIKSHLPFHLSGNRFIVCYLPVEVDCSIIKVSSLCLRSNILLKKNHADRSLRANTHQFIDHPVFLSLNGCGGHMDLKACRAEDADMYVRKYVTKGLHI